MKPPKEGHKKREHWYYTSITVCPPCGREQVIKERRYGKKPVNPGLRVSYKEVYDWCQEGY
jgi:hypothetical protein